ncbi:hypothetical protein GVN24_34950 [Rhizobium sp. CRIBSB]|nr:hypothetical protein [Rhizobium sp. CRIBSB]
MRSTLTLAILTLTLAACNPAPAEVAGSEPADATAAGVALSEASGVAITASVEAVQPDVPQAMPADPDRPRPPRMDGPMTLEAMEQRALRGLERLDANGDGVVTAAELEGAEGGRGGRMVARADQNGDGRVTRDEVIASTRAAFRLMDSNGDGKVTEEERPQFGQGGPR